MRTLILYAVIAFTLAGCNRTEIDALKNENSGLKNEVKSLQAEVNRLQDTAENRFKQGQEYLASKDWALAIRSFNIVITKYPNDPLSSLAKTALMTAESLQKTYLKEVEESERDARAAAEKAIAEEGESIAYGDFYALLRTGIKVGKRYKFDACYSTASSCVINRSMSVDQNICDIEPRFDDPSEYSSWLSAGTKYCGPIVASALWGGTVAMHRLH